MSNTSSHRPGGWPDTQNTPLDCRNRISKEKEQARKVQTIQKDIAAKREREKAENKLRELQDKRRAEEFASLQRKAKQDAWAWQTKNETDARLREEAEVKARFKASEAERTQREADKRLADKVEARKQEADFRARVEEEKHAEAESRKEKEKAHKAALKEAIAAQ
jgi:hypothetical protein